MRAVLIIVDVRRYVPNRSEIRPDDRIDFDGATTTLESARILEILNTVVSKYQTFTIENAWTER